MRQIVFWGLMALGVFMVLAVLGVLARLALVIGAVLLLPVVLVFKLVFSKTVILLLLMGLVIAWLVGRRRKMEAAALTCRDLEWSMGQMEARLDRLSARW